MLQSLLILVVGVASMLLFIVARATNNVRFGGWVIFHLYPSLYAGVGGLLLWGLVQDFGVDAALWFAMYSFTSFIFVHYRSMLKKLFVEANEKGFIKEIAKGRFISLVGTAFSLGICIGFLIHQ